MSKVTFEGRSSTHRPFASLTSPTEYQGCIDTYFEWAESYDTKAGLVVEKNCSDTE